MSFPQPDFEYKEEVSYDVLQDRFPNIVQRMPRSEKAIRIFNLVYENRKKQDKDDVRAEFVGTKGAAGTTSYTPVDSGAALTVRFSQDEFTWQMDSATVYSFSFSLIEDVR